ncbi:SRPBCC domain-containing protein [Euzebya tangerina]|uniref:SRPBCC domain-containing protein n=1 Tax=Euzebya tangerina TaxID=591198 RepID=UPI000E31C97A|nr:SRPBCC domain-containing protein [Euzebya tangerina]
MAVTRYHVERTINAPARAVWDLLTDATSYPDWNPAVVSITGPIELGRTIQLRSIVNPKRTFKLTVTEMSAPNRLVWSDGLPLGLFTGERTFRLDETDRVTRFSMTEEFSGLLAGLITRSIPDMTESFNQFADGLKQAAETSG